MHIMHSSTTASASQMWLMNGVLYSQPPHRHHEGDKEQVYTREHTDMPLKCLGYDGVTVFGGVGIWSLPIKDGDTWMPGEYMTPFRVHDIQPCRKGYHLSTLYGLPTWIAPKIYAAQILPSVAKYAIPHTSTMAGRANKIVCASARLLAEVEEWTPLVFCEYTVDLMNNHYIGFYDHLSSVSEQTKDRIRVMSESVTDVLRALLRGDMQYADSVKQIHELRRFLYEFLPYKYHHAVENLPSIIHSARIHETSVGPGRPWDSHVFNALRRMVSGTDGFLVDVHTDSQVWSQSYLNEKLNLDKYRALFHEAQRETMSKDELEQETE